MVKLSDIVREWLDARHPGYEISVDNANGFTCLSWENQNRHICVNSEYAHIYSQSYIDRLYLHATDPEFFTKLEAYMAGKLVPDKGWEAV